VRANAAERLIVDEFTDLARSAHGTGRIAHHTDRLKPKRESFYDEQPSHQGVSETADGLDDFGGLQDSDETREDAEDAGVVAILNDARRWRLWIQASVARTAGRPEN
jgi:hypothetical protein